MESMARLTSSGRRRTCCPSLTLTGIMICIAPIGGNNVSNVSARGGKLISFEGLDGAGKTTQMELLARWLDERPIDYIRPREPGGTPLGVEIRRLLFSQPELEISPLAEAFLFQADRAQHFQHLI